MDEIKVSLVAYKLFLLLCEREGLYHLSELTRELACSKSKLLNAIYELEELGLISYDVEE